MNPRTDYPLVIDLDGTLTKVDTLHESIIALCRINPFFLFAILFWLTKGRAFLKARVAERVTVNVQTLPYRNELLDYLRSEKARGRRLVLATAANQAVALRVNEHLGLFDSVIASSESDNVKGDAKLRAIVERIGPEFVYAGNSSDDRPIWAQSTGAIVAGKAARWRTFPHPRMLGSFGSPRAGLQTWARQLRLHQWAKNLLVFVPILTAFQFGIVDKLLSVFLGFICLSLCASATYILNDLVDIDSDRSHPRKKSRPIASGDIDCASAVVAMLLLLLLAFGLAAAIRPILLPLLLTYWIITTLYSLVLKRLVLVDIIVLSCLYTHRIITGALLSEIAVSQWLLVFSILTFIGLALIKRCAELISTPTGPNAILAGRGYRTDDLAVLAPIGASASISAVVVFCLFINAPETIAHYQSPQLLWLATPGLLYLFANLWLATIRKTMHDDPVVYVLRDTSSLVAIAAVGLSMTAAHLVVL